MAYFMSTTDQQILIAALVITGYVDGVVFILGTVGNVMNIIVFCGLKTYRSLVTSAFLATTAFAGQLYLTVSLGFGSISKWIGYDIASRNSAICKFTLYMRNVSIQIYLTCLCLSSIDRYLMTSRSVRRREWMTLKRARLLIYVWTIVWACAGIPHAIYTNNIPLFNLCIPISSFSSTVTYLNLVFAIILPIGILSVFGLLTWKNLRNTRLTTLNSQVTRMILLDVIVVTISSIPLGMFLIYSVTSAMSRFFTPTETLLVVLAQLISTLQAFGSFYFYLISSSTFRNNVKKIPHNIIAFCKQRTIHQIAPTATAPIELNQMPKVVA